nr:helicase-associated domain-containing protein [Leucobacter exalbidus]
MLPAAAVNVYLQPDLTVLAPGPLDPQSEALLAELTLPEQIGPASMRRITEASLAAAFERGLTPAEARETFERLSFTGVPQPLDYLLTSVAERIGRIVVQEHYGAEGRSRIRVALPALAETVLVDRQLQHLQLTRASASLPGDVTVLFSRLRPDHVVTAFSEARYHASLAGDPAARGLNSRGTGAASTSAVTEPTTYTGADAATELPAESPDAPAVASGGEEQAQPDSAAPDTAAIAVSAPATAATTDEAPAPHPYEALIERVFVAARTEPEAAAFTRRLELAIRDKTPVNVTAESRGQRRTFKLLPVALTDGRLRATDGPAGVERTFPVSMIVSVDPA